MCMAMRMCMCMCMCMCICACPCACACAHAHVHVHVHVHMRMPTCMCMCACAWASPCACACAHVVTCWSTERRYLPVSVGSRSCSPFRSSSNSSSKVASSPSLSSLRCSEAASRAARRMCEAKLAWSPSSAGPWSSGASCSASSACAASSRGCSSVSSAGWRASSRLAPPKCSKMERPWWASRACSASSRRCVSLASFLFCRLSAAFCCADFAPGLAGRPLFLLPLRTWARWVSEASPSSVPPALLAMRVRRVKAS